MNVTVNGESQRLRPGATVADVVVSLGHQPSGRGVAAALNGEVVRRTEWRVTEVREGDRLEILEATQGG
jgi:sulfur carrier protein